MVTTTHRLRCGTHMGLLLHKAAGEPACGECLEGDMMRRLFAEEVPRRPSHPANLPVSRKQADQNRATLLAAVYGPPDLLEDLTMPAFATGPDLQEEM
ncbi:hypothetical protein AB0L65_32885 [Nonomuraea sp. NPDC052116]|uniref:hypothetical protein n=1 Tax=Nonomuraea sp. NPDC052116 TaxID=3155665 RepID=UPI00343C6D3A